MSDETKALKEIKDRLVTEFNAALSRGAETVDTHEMGEVADAIKDMSESIAKCYEAKYYEAVTKAMEKGSEESEWPEEDENYRMYYYRPPMPRMGYDATMVTAPYRNNAWRMDDRSSMDYGDRSYDPETERYGRTYSDYKKARRNYTDTKSETDRMRMNDTATMHIDNTIASLHEMWNDAEPAMRARMKENLTKLVNEMVV